MASKTTSKTASAALKDIDKDIDAVLGTKKSTTKPRPGKKTSKGAGNKSAKTASKSANAAGKKAASGAHKKANGLTGDAVDYVTPGSTVTSDDPTFLRKVGAPKSVINRLVSLNKENPGFRAVRTNGVWGVSRVGDKVVKSAKNAGKKIKTEAKKVAGKVKKTAKNAGKKIKTEAKKVAGKVKNGGATTHRNHKRNQLMQGFERKFHWWNTESLPAGILTPGKPGPSIPFHSADANGMVDYIDRQAKLKMMEARSSIIEMAKKTGAKGIDLIFAAAFLVYGEVQDLALKIADSDHFTESDYCMLAYLLSPHTADDILRNVGLSPWSYTKRLPEIHEAFRRLILSHLTKRMQGHFSFKIAFDLEDSGDVSAEDTKAYVKHRESQSPNRIN
jgi:hypothetical protein